MFKWLTKLFTRRSGTTANRQVTGATTANKYVDEEEQLKEILEVMKKNPNNSEIMKIMASDFEKRSKQKDDRGTASSPISSP